MTDHDEMLLNNLHHLRGRKLDAAIAYLLRLSPVWYAPRGK